MSKPKPKAKTKERAAVPVSIPVMRGEPRCMHMREAHHCAKGEINGEVFEAYVPIQGLNMIVRFGKFGDDRVYEISAEALIRAIYALDHGDLASDETKAIALEHEAGDKACGRKWSCACGACRQVRKEGT